MTLISNYRALVNKQEYSLGVYVFVYLGETGSVAVTPEPTRDSCVFGSST